MSFYEFKWEDRNEKEFCVLIEKVSVSRFACLQLKSLVLSAMFSFDMC